MRAPCRITWLTWHSQARVVRQRGGLSVMVVVRMVVTRVGFGGTRAPACWSVECATPSHRHGAGTLTARRRWVPGESPLPERHRCPSAGVEVYGGSEHNARHWPRVVAKEWGCDRHEATGSDRGARRAAGHARRTADRFPGPRRPGAQMAVRASQALHSASIVLRVQGPGGARG